MRKLLLLLLAMVAGAFPLRPRYYDKSIANLHIWHTFQDTMTVFSGTGYHSKLDSATPWILPYSNILANDSGKDVIYQKILAAPINICADSFVRVAYKFSSRTNMARLGKAKFYLATNASNTWTYDGAFYIKDTTAGGPGVWRWFTMTKSKFTKTGSPRCDSITTLLIETLANGGKDTVEFGEWDTYPDPLLKAVLMFTIDDQWTSFDSLSMTKFAADNMTFAEGVNGGLLGAFAKRTGAQIDSLRLNFGVVPFTHGWTHDSVTNVSDDSLTKIIRLNDSLFVTMGWKLRDFYAYPYGLTTLHADSVIAATKLIDYARLTLSNSEGEPAPWMNPMHIRALAALSSALSLAAAEAGINGLIADKDVGIIYGHKLCHACVLDANTWRDDTLGLLLDFIKTKVDSGLITVTTPDKYLQWEPWTPGKRVHGGNRGR